MEKFVGDMQEGTIECLNQSLALFNPTTVYLSVVRGDGSEDTLTFGGPEPTDAYLTNVGVGLFHFVYPLALVGRYSFLGRWIDTTSGLPITRQSPCAAVVRVIYNPHQFGDRS